jgi:hypothetical protein
MSTETPARGRYGEDGSPAEGNTGNLRAMLNEIRKIVIKMIWFSSFLLKICIRSIDFGSFDIFCLVPGLTSRAITRFRPMVRFFAFFHQNFIKKQQISPSFDVFHQTFRFKFQIPPKDKTFTRRAVTSIKVVEVEEEWNFRILIFRAKKTKFWSNR